MDVRILLVAGLMVAVFVSIASAQQGTQANSGASDSIAPRPIVAAVPVIDSRTIFTSEEAMKSHPKTIQVNLKLIAEQFTAAGLNEEAHTVRDLQQRVEKDLSQRLLAAYKVAVAKAVEPQIAMKVQVFEFSESASPEDSLSLLKRRSVTATNGTRGMECIGGVYPREDVATWIEDLIRNGRIKIIATPNITILNGRQARIIRGGGEVAVPKAVKPGTRSSSEGGQSDEVAEPAIEYVQTGTSVLVSAKVAADRHIKIALNASHIDLQQFPPDPLRMNAEVDLCEGQSLVAAGFATTAYKSEVTMIPVLGSTPFIGRFFSKKKLTQVLTELMFVVTPEIVDVTLATAESEEPPLPGLRSLSPVKPVSFARPEK